ncbi:hypothetical protein HYR69_11030 [Candidatus Sumerlaeota bacterium]|nr:hypothetical protein [Candidatus Sumerlaeota bacterium]
MIKELSPDEVRELLKADPSIRLLDVRQDFEMQIARIERAEQLTESLANELLAHGDRNAPYIFMCHHGVRSYSAAAFFAEHGFTNVASMSGGIHAWSTTIDPAIPTY